MRQSGDDPAGADGAGPRVVIIGGGFAGLRAARALRRTAARITLVDRRNYHLFQPLLYQVATASLSPADIAAPIRHVLGRQKNVRVLLADAVAIDADRRSVKLADGELAYDYLVLAAGVTHSYFGHEEWAPLAPALKNVPDALEIRRRFLLAFEAAEREPDPARRRACLTFVVVGAGPTGVELAGAMIEIAHRAIPRDFRAVDTTTARVLLVEGLPRVLPTFAPALSDRARRDLERLGVEVRTGERVTGVDAHGVWIGKGDARERVEAGCVFWAAGVKASPLARTIAGASIDELGRVMVGPDLAVPGRPELFVVGDLAHCVDPATDEPVPGVAPAAMQMGDYVGRIIAREVAGRVTPESRGRFHYLDKGMLATIGRARAVGQLGGMKLAGPVAWWIWLGVHIFYLIGFRNRLLVLIQWAWAYFTFERGARLITSEGGPAGAAAPGDAATGSDA